MQLPLAPPRPLVRVPPPERTAPRTLLTSMIAHTGPRKLQINPVSVSSQQLWRETGGVGACLRPLTLQVTTPAPPSALMEGKLGAETGIKTLLAGQVAFRFSLDPSKSSF